MEYKTELLDIVNNPNYTYYKLYVDDKCLFDEFVEEVSRSVKNMKELKTIYAYMDFLGAQLLPKEKFNSIEDGKRSDLFEFKTKHLRVYIILDKPYVYVVAGGYKVTQDKDIARFKKRIKGFPETK